MKNTFRLAVAALSAASAWGILPACTGGTTNTTTAPVSANAATSPSGALLCAPTQAQLDACTGKAGSDGCSLSRGDAGTSIAGTCRSTIDGAKIACVPNPPAPPQALIDACSGHAAGDSCQATERDRHMEQGICAAAPGGSTLACFHFHSPPQAAIDACSGHASGDSCTLPGHRDAGTIAGTCSLGPASTGPLACRPAHELEGDVTAACVGLAAGSACTLSSRHEHAAGSCVMPADGGAEVCVIPCDSEFLEGRYEHGPGHRGRRGH
jgi:hypothetical protein